MRNKSSDDVVTRDSLWKLADYRTWFIGDTASEIGAWLTSIAMTLLAYSVTKDVWLASIIGAAEATSRALTILPGGVISDVFDRRKLMIVAAAASAVPFAAIAVLYIVDRLSFWPLLFICLAKGALTGLFGKVTNVILPVIVPADRLPSATALNQSRDAAINLASGPVGGFLFSLSPLMPFLLSIASFFAELWAALRIKADLRPEPTEHDESLLLKLRLGIRWVFSNRLPRTNFFVFLAFNLSWTGIVTVVTLNLLATGASATAVGGATALMGGGVLLGGIVSGWLGSRLRGGALLQLAYVWILAMSMTVMSATEWWAAGLILGAAAVGIVPMNSTLQSYMAVRTPNNVLGRMISVMVLSTMIAVGASSALGGALLATIGFVYAVGALGLIGLIGIILCTGSSEIRGIPARSAFGELDKIS